MHISDTVINTFFWTMLGVSLLTCLVLVFAEYVLHRPIQVRIPSVYWPIAKLGFSPNRNVRRAFRVLFCELYRKRFWNPLINTWVKLKGFDRKRHLSGTNNHAACSAVVLILIFFFVYTALKYVALLHQSFWQHFLANGAMLLVGFELIFNVPAIVLGRYLYLLTLRRPGLNRRTKHA